MSISSALASGDIAAIVDKLMKLESRPLQRLELSRNTLDYQQKAYDALKQLLTRYSDALEAITPAMKTLALKANSSSESVASIAVTGNAATPGSHALTVTNLAQTHQISSAAQSAKNTAFGIGGDLTLGIGSNTMTVSITTDDTLETMRDKINHSLSNVGVTASILATNGAGGASEYRLVVSANNTGLASKITAGGGLAASLDLTHELQEAKDATFTLDGFSVTRASNVITDVMEGLTINLNAIGAATLSVNQNTTARDDNVKAAVHALVDAYNAIVEAVDKNQATGGQRDLERNLATAGLRDSTFSLVKNQLKSALFQSVGEGSVVSLFQAGITLAEEASRVNDDGVKYYVTGRLKIDDAKLEAALRDDMPALQAFFENAAGVVKKSESALENLQKMGGAIDSRTKSIQVQDSELGKRIDREEARLEVVRLNLVKQYAALDTFVQKYDQLSQFLEKQFNSLSNSGSGRR